jgi:2-hydroxychromene-2-carboxylate isomerase
MPVGVVMAEIGPLPGGPYDIEFFFDTGCPYAWMTSRWVHQVIEAKGIGVGWRFVSLRMINEGSDVPESYTAASMHGLRFHRICAAARERFGNDAVGRLYTENGLRYWEMSLDKASGQTRADVRASMDVAAIITAAGLPADLLESADDESFDAVIRAETEGAFERTGPDVGTPIITYVESGNSLFGPVISSLPDVDTAVRFYDALRVMVDFRDFSELKRSSRAPLDLPLLA